MGTKRSAINIDPDYEDVTEHHNKRQRLLEEDAKESTRKKIEKIICDQFMIEEMQKEREVDIIDQKLNQARQMMDRLRACIVANFYSSTGQQKMFQVKPGVQQQIAIHPNVKEHLGKKPKFTDSTMSDKNAEDMIWKKKFTTSVKLESRCNVEVKKEPIEEAPENSNSILPDQSTSRTSRFKVKKRIIVGNVSKYIPVDKREENDQSTHKWMVYVRGSKEEPKIDHFVKKVWFFLHPSYRPNDLVEVSQPPFHLTRRGWGEFPVRIQLHFYDQRNKRVDIIHPLKLDRTYTGLQTLGAETVVDIELEREKSFTSTLSGVVSMDATSMFKFGRKDGIKIEPGVKNEQNFTIAEQITPKKIKTDSELYKRLSEGQITPKTKGKITPSPKGSFSDLFSSKSSSSSKGVDNTSQDNSNLSNKENFYEGEGRLQESPSKCDGNIQPQNVVTPVLKAGGLVGENLVKQTSSVGQSQNASFASMVTPTGIITVNKVTDGSGLSAFTQSSSNVQVVLGGFGSLTSPGVNDTKSPIVTGSQGSTLNQVIMDNKQSIILGGTSSSAKSETLILASNSPSQSPSIMNKKAKSKSVSPAKASTSQSSSTIILQGMGSLSKSSVPGGNKNNSNAMNLSENPAIPNSSPSKSAPIENSGSNPSSLYIRCRDNQGNIFLVPQHLLKQITNPTSDKTCTPTSATSSGMVSLPPQNTVTSSQMLPQQPVVQMSSSTPPNKNDNSATSVLPSSLLSLKTAKSESQNASLSGAQGKSSPLKSLPGIGKVTEGIKNTSTSVVKEQNSAAQSLISGSVINSQSRSESPSSTALKTSTSSSSAALRTSTPQILVRFPQGDELNNSSGTSLLNSSQLQSGSGNVAPSSPRGQLKVTSQGLKVVPTGTPSVILDRTGNIVSGVKPSQQQTSILKSDKQVTRKSMTVSALLKENASQNKHSLVKNTQISSLKQGQSGEPNSEMKLVAITTNSDSKTPMLVLAPQDKNAGSNVKQVTQSLGTKVNSPEKQSYNFVLSNAKDGSQCFSLLPNKPGVVSSNASSKLSTSHNVSTNSSKAIATTSGSALHNTAKCQSVTLNLSQGQSSSLISGQQSKTVLATIGNQTLLLQLPVSEVKTSEGTSLSLLSGNQSCTSQTVVKETTSKLSSSRFDIDQNIVKPGSQITEQFEPVTSSREPEKKIFVWKKKKCYETAPVPSKEIPPIRVIDFPDVMSLVRAAVKRHPVVCQEIDQSQHPYCAKTIDDWLSWNIGKRRASEWQRASTVKRFIKQQIGGLDSFKGTQLWSTKQIMTWCRLHAYSPHYLEKTLHPTPLELSADSNTMGKKFSSSTDSTSVLLQLHDVQCSSRSEDNSDDEIDIIGIEPPKVKIKEEPSEIKVCDNPTTLPPSDEAIFIQDTALKIGVKFEPSEVVPEVFTSTSEDLIFTAMESFISELLTETFALKVNLGRYPDGIGVGDVYKALLSSSKFEFLTNRHLGVKDVGTDTITR